MPLKKARKPKKPVQQKQKQKQSQRVVVNVNQARPAKRRPVARARQPQQVSYQPIITMTGSVPVPQPSYNPIQSSGGFNPTPPPPSLGTPISSSAPVELPVFADESVKVVGDEPMTAPIPTPVSRPVDIIVPINPVIPDDTPIVMPKPIPPPKPIITSPPPSLVTDDSDRRKFIIPPQKPPPARSEMKPDDGKSVSTLLSELSKDTGINPKAVADFLFKKKKQPDKPTPVPPVDRNRPPARVSGSQVSVSTGSNSESILASNAGSRVEELSDTSGYETATRAVRDAERKNREIALRYESEGGFNIPSDNSLTRNSIIVGGALPTIVSSGSSGKTKSNPYDPFAQSDMSVSGQTVSETEASLKVIKPMKKRVVESDSELSDTGANIIPQERKRKPPTPAPVKLEPIKEKKSSYVSKADLQQIAKDKKINIFRPTGKEKTMNELRIEIAG